MEFIVVILVWYCVVLILLFFGWHKATHKFYHKPSITSPFISIIVPVRNEEKNLRALLESIRLQDYINFEVILVDDGSTDRSVELAHGAAPGNCTIVSNRGQGKKAALTSGVAIAKGSIIATTDADCVLPKTWLTSICRLFEYHQVQFVFGPVRMVTLSTLFHELQSLEFLSLIGSGAATAALGFPTMCNGANLAYRKAAFEKVNGYEGNLHIASGDDEFLMQKIFRQYPQGIRFLGADTAIVDTHPQHNVHAFLQQRLRWASKWRFNTSLFTKGLAIFIATVQTCWLLALLSLILLPTNYLLLIILVKVTFEMFFLYSVSTWLRVRWNWKAFFLLQFLYPLYVVVVGTAANFFSVLWKERRV